MDKNIIEEYKKIDWKKLLKEDMGEYRLKEVVVNFERIKSQFDFIINNKNTESLSRDHFLNNIESRLRHFINFSKSVVTGYTDSAQKKGWLDKIKNEEALISQQLSPIISYLMFFSEKNEDELQNAISDTLKIKKSIEEKAQEVDELLTTSKKRAQNQEISEFGTFFEDTAKLNKKTARTNLIFMIAMIIFTAIIALTLNINVPNDSGEWWKQLLYAISQVSFLEKLILISLSGYLVAHFSRNYSVEMDQHVQNTHRQNALNSHKQIIKSVQTTEKSENDKEIQNAILLQATKAMFDVKQSGYGKISNTSPVITNQILETVKKTN